MSQATEGVDARFPPEVEEALRRAGWYPGRRVEENTVAVWCRELSAYSGCRVFPAAVEVLREFGGLEIDKPGAEPRADDENSTYHLSVKFWPSHLDAVTRRGWLAREWVLNEVLFPIGVYSVEEIFLAVSSTKRIYGFGYGMWFCGENIDEALEKWSHNVPTWEKILIPDFDDKVREANLIYDNLAANS